MTKSFKKWSPRSCAACLSKRPSVLSAQGLRHLVRIANDGITARVFGVLNELAIDAVETGTECISDTVIETWKPAIEKEAAFA